MASWADQIPTFGPYIQQQPVEAMVAVGMEKQRRYDEGVQRIQSAIDRVAGLDIVRDVDRNYLQSKLNDLGTRLRAVSAGDFSNYQLVNSTSGMATKIAKDPNVMSAVKSTAWYRKQIELMQKDSQEGKSNPANDFWFNKRASKWLNSTTLGESFNTNYFTPRDVWGKIKDIAGQVGVTESDIMELFETDAQGNYVMEKDKDGVKRPRFNHIMAEKILKGKDPAAVLSAFQNSLTSADFQQLAMEGEYQFASHTPEMLKDSLISSSREQAEDIKIMTDKLTNELSKEKGKNDKDNVKIASLEKQIDYYNRQAKNIQNSLEQGLAIADSNPDAIRASIFTNKYLYSMSKSLSPQSVAVKYSLSPWHTVWKDQRDFQWEQQKEARRIVEWNAKYAQDERKIKQDWDMFELKLAAENTSGVSEGYSAGPVSAEDAINQKASVIAQGEQLTADRDSIAMDISTDYYKRINKRADGESIAAYNRRIAEMIKDEADSKGISIYELANEKAAEELSNPNKIYTNTSLLGKYKKAMREVQDFNDNIKDIKEETDRIAKERGLNIPSEDEMKKQLGGTTVSIRRGYGDTPREIRLSSEDMLDFIYTEPALLKRLGGELYLDFSNKEDRERASKSKDKLKKKFGDDYELIKDKVVPTDIFGSPKTSLLHPNITSLVESFNNKDFQERTKIEADLYSQRGMLQRPIYKAILEGKEKNADMISRVSEVAAAMGLDTEDIQKALHTNGDKSIRVYANPRPDGTTTFKLQVQQANGKTVEMDISAENYTRLTNEVPPQNVKEPIVVRRLRTYGTTNETHDSSSLNAEDNATTAYFDETDFPNFKSDEYKIRGDLVVDKGDPGKAWLVIYLFDRDGNFIGEGHYPKDKDRHARIDLYDRGGKYDMSIENITNGIDYNVVNELMKLE